MGTEHVQTKREIATALEAVGIHPRKRFGQNFLIDGNLMRRLVAAADLSANDLVLEVGGGTGGLTDLLAARAGRVICVEIDHDLQGLLKDRFAEADHVTIIEDDVLKRKYLLAAGVRDALAAFDNRSGGAVKLVANLPYQVATPLLMNLLIDYPQVRRLCFTVQREVGDRLAAEPGTKDYGPLSIITRLLGRVEIIAKLPPHVFWPRPTIESVMMRMDVHDGFTGDLVPANADRAWVGRLARFVRGVFDHRRKTLRGALRKIVDPEDVERICADFDGTRRPESFEHADWPKMFRLVE